MKYNSDTFCPLPWIHLLIGETGNFQVCCRSSVSENEEFLGIKMDFHGKLVNPVLKK